MPSSVYIILPRAIICYVFTVFPLHTPAKNLESSVDEP